MGSPILLLAGFISSHVGVTHSTEMYEYVGKTRRVGNRVIPNNRIGLVSGEPLLHSVLEL
jgi:hypothetical protein